MPETQSYQMRTSIGIAIVLLIVLGTVYFRTSSKGAGDSIENNVSGVNEVLRAKEAVAAIKKDTINCADTGCEGEYTGPEFVAGSDVAHQFSNTMSGRVGDKLKALYKKGSYVKVDFSQIEMVTEGMGTGNVIFKLRIPFQKVTEKCDAYTSFDHVGGWDHKPALARRTKELGSVLMNGHTLEISELKTTPEGLQEHWIQWKHKVTQAACE